MKEQIDIKSIVESITIRVSPDLLEKMVQTRLEMLLNCSKLAQKRLSELGIEYKS